MTVKSKQFALDLEAVRSKTVTTPLRYSAYSKAQLKDVFNEAVRSKNWEVAKDICNLPGAKPPGATKEALLEIPTKLENWTDVYEIGKAFRKEDYAPLPGPMPKSVYTMAMEEICRGLMRGEDFSFSKGGKGGRARYNYSRWKRV